MTYCVAWKKNEHVFLLADSITSTLLEEDFLTGTSSFGEIEGLYTNYWVRETSQKIIKVNENTAVAYSCNDEKLALDVINNFYYIDTVSIKEILYMICNSYTSDEFELIVISKTEDKNRIFHLKNSKFKEIEEFISIGSGNLIPNLSSAIKEVINEYDNENQNDNGIYLANVISTLQCMSLKHHYIQYGVGGAYFGLYLGDDIKWCKDLMYHFSNNIENKNVISLLCRYDTIFYASSYNGDYRYFFDKAIQKKLKENKYVLESIVKTLNTVIPHYVVFYDFQTNSRVFITINAFSVTDQIKLWIKRCANEVKYAILPSLNIATFLRDCSASNELIPLRYMINSSPTTFIPREEFIIENGLESLVLDLDLLYDFDFKYIRLRSDALIKKRLEGSISQYRNIIIIDAHYLDTLINEKITYYRQANIEMKLGLDLNLRLEPIVKKFATQIASDRFEDYSIQLLVNKRISSYLKTIIVDWKLRYHNFFITEDNNENYLTKNIVSTIKDFYKNESFFHIDKIILFCEDPRVNEILQLVPESNFEMENVDILLIREINLLTNMDGRFRYIMSDWLIGEMYDLPYDAIGYSEMLIEKTLIANEE
ncbi:hypothetical protein [Jeotgalibacillus salarius]|uniref:Uncharacterized protein n=1 Tax=Jeotgalibacillus salarius TaxID=546023 RepID=A0A4Y8LEF2_9BACL|nr:hypothetical protein [Jeotgalibacillus salarius]TFE00696.1 hypothetical protein E2626_12045 [Jeotgalibacillus salarius]